MKKCMNMTVEGTSLKGRRMTWLKTVQNDMNREGTKIEILAFLMKGPPKMKI